MILGSLIAGLLFGLGLAVSGMVNPAKVLAFLDLFGDWDPSLMLVMGAALVPSFIAYRSLPKRPRPLYDTGFHLPTATHIDARLIAGAVLFGVGWGLVGLCPGPAIASLAYGHLESIVFFAAMAGGIGMSRMLPGGAPKTPETETG